MYRKLIRSDTAYVDLTKRKEGRTYERTEKDRG